MSHHPALAPGKVAVITGAGGGIGRAVAERLAGFGMRLCLADIDEAGLAAAQAAIAAKNPEAEAMVVPTDVSGRSAVEALRDRVLTRWGGADFLMSNAGIEGGGGLLADPARWRRIIEVNLWGNINCLQVFLPGMIERGEAGAIVVTGSKQGITTPPGNTAYNISKAGSKVLAEGLAHELRNIAGCPLTAHLLIPGFTFTGLTRARGVTEKPDAAWTSEQVADFMLDGLAAGDFYILCPDNETPRQTDAKRVLWAAEDIVENRPALSRWHPDYKQAFADFMNNPNG